jgi:hypothetical protein
MLIPIKPQADLPALPNGEPDSVGVLVQDVQLNDLRTVFQDPQAALANEMVRYVNLKAALEAEDLDPQTLLDTLEGETNLLEALAEVAESIAEDECFAEALTTRIRTIQERKSRLEHAAETKRNLVIMAMEKAHLKSVKQPNATISVRATKPRLVVVDEALVPGKFFKSPEPILDRTALKAALEDLPREGKIPGAELSHGGVSLTIRVK